MSKHIATVAPPTLVFRLRESADVKPKMPKAAWIASHVESAPCGTCRVEGATHMKSSRKGRSRQGPKAWVQDEQRNKGLTESGHSETKVGQGRSRSRAKQGSARCVQELGVEHPEGLLVLMLMKGT